LLAGAGAPATIAYARSLGRENLFLAALALSLMLDPPGLLKETWFFTALPIAGQRILYIGIVAGTPDLSRGIAGPTNRAGLFAGLPR